MPTHRFLFRADIPALALVFAAMSASAQTPEATPSTTELSGIEVNASADASAEGLPPAYAGGRVARGGRVGILGNQDMMSTPFSSTSYTSELIQDQQAQSVADVLRNDPSVRQARGFGNFQELYVVRGFPVYSDDVAYNGLYGMLPRQYIAAEFFERVEVFRGANTFLNGAAPGGSGIGGAINLLPKRAPNEPLRRVGLGLQTGGQTSLTADLAQRFGPDDSTGIRLIGARREGGTGVDREERELSAVGLGLDWRGERVRLSADVGYQNNGLRGGRPSVTPLAGVPIPSAPDSSRNFGQSWTYSRERTTFGTVRAEWDIAENVTAWAAGGLRGSHESNRLSGLTMADAAGGATGNRFDNERIDRVRTGEVGLRAKVMTGSVGHTLVASAATFHSKERNAYAISTTTLDNDLYSPFQSPMLAAPSAGGALDDPGLVNRVKTRSIAIADTMSFLDETVLLTLGLRRQAIAQTSYAYGTAAQTDHYDRSKTTPVAGILFKATEQVSLYGNYIEGLVKGDVAPATANGLPVTNGGQVFAPYSSKQKEVGVKFDGGRLGGSVALFSTDRPIAYVENQTYGQYGKQRNRGLELMLFGEPLKGFRVLGGLTLLDAEQRSTQGGATDGRDAVGIPKRQFNAGVEWDVPGMRNLSLDARVLHTSRQYADAANTQSTPSWTRFDLGARYMIDVGGGRTLTLRARIDNLFDRDYWASVGGFPGANYLVLSQPRTFVVSGTLEF